MDKNIHTVILNCAQYEPLVHIQEMLLLKYTREIMRTFAKIGKTFNANNIIVAVGKKDVELLECLQDVLDDYPSLSLKVFDGAYPAGDEYVLTYELTGQNISADSSPLEEGIAVFNAESVYNMFMRVNKGVQDTHKWVSVLGEVENPITLKVPVGVKAQDVIKTTGAITCENPVIILGGPMSGKIGNKYSRVDKTTDAIIILPEDSQVVENKKTNSSIELKRATSSCCNCMRCTDLCPRFLLGHPVDPHAFICAASSKDTKNVGTYLNTMFCSSCGLCEMYSCVQGISLKMLLTECKNGLKENGIIDYKASMNEVDSERKYRKISMKRLTSRLGLSRYDRVTELKEYDIPGISVRISLKDNTQSPAEILVKENDSVIKGQLLARYEQDDICSVYSGIDGVVTEVTEKYILIENQGGRTDNE